MTIRRIIARALAFVRDGAGVVRKLAADAHDRVTADVPPTPQNLADALGVRVVENAAPRCYKCGGEPWESAARKRARERYPEMKLRPVCAKCAWDNLQAALADDDERINAKGGVS